MSIGYVNKFELVCRVVSLHETKTGRKSATVFSKYGKEIYVHVRINDEQYELLKGTRHAMVSITGHISNRRVPSRTEKDKYMLSQQLVADEIKFADTLTDKYFGVKGKFYLPLSLNIYICGVLTDTYVNDKGWTKYTVNTFDNDNRKTSIVAYMGVVDRKPDVKNGDMVCMVCSMSTPKKTVGDVTINYEDIIVSDIAKA